MIFALLGVLVNQLQHPPAPLHVGHPGGGLAPPVGEGGHRAVHDDLSSPVDVLVVQPRLRPDLPYAAGLDLLQGGLR